MDLNSICKFIPVSDADDFADYDNCSGYNRSVYVTDGIVVSNEMYNGYKSFVADFESQQLTYKNN